MLSCNFLYSAHTCYTQQALHKLAHYTVPSWSATFATAWEGQTRRVYRLAGLFHLSSSNPSSSNLSASFPFSAGYGSSVATQSGDKTKTDQAAIRAMKKRKRQKKRAARRQKRKNKTRKNTEKESRRGRTRHQRTRKKNQARYWNGRYNNRTTVVD